MSGEVWEVRGGGGGGEGGEWGMGMGDDTGEGGGSGRGEGGGKRGGRHAREMAYLSLVHVGPFLREVANQLHPACISFHVPDNSRQKGEAVAL
jgi:hypothetical protein